jgi:hypothetical protein
MKWLFKTWLAVFTFVYCLAVFEVNTEYMSNTWGDEYDLYIGSPNSSAKLVKIFDVNSPLGPFNTPTIFPVYFQNTTRSFAHYGNPSPHGGCKRYLVHCPYGYDARRFVIFRQSIILF